MFQAIIAIASTVLTQIATKLPFIIETVKAILAKPEVMNFLMNVMYDVAHHMLKDKPPVIDDATSGAAVKAREDGIKIENFEHFNEYLEAISKYKLESFEEVSEKELILHKSILFIVQMSALLGPEILPLINIIIRTPEYYDANKINCYISYFKEHNLKLSDLEAYYSGDMAKIGRVEMVKHINAVEKLAGNGSEEGIKQIINTQKY